MAINRRSAWIVAYDVRQPRRLSRVHRLLKKHAVPVQYSVFWYEGTAVEVQRLFFQIAAVVDRRADDVRAYRVPLDTNIVTYGRPVFPDGVISVPAPLDAPPLGSADSRRAPPKRDV